MGLAIFENQELLKPLPNEILVYNAEVTAIDLAMNIIGNHYSFRFIYFKSVLLALQNRYISSSQNT